MAKDQAQEGDREEGEIAPADDSHIAARAMKAIQDAAAGIVASQGTNETQAGNDTSEMVDVEIDGTTFKMTNEGAEAYSKQQAAYVDNLAAANTTEDTEQTEEQDQEKVDYQTLFFTDPVAAAAKIKDEIREELRGEYLQDKALSIFWDDFYRENPELKEEDTFVRMVLASKMDELKNLKGKTGRDGLATAVQGELVRIQNKGKSGPTKRTGTEYLEGALPGTGEVQKEVEITTTSKVASLGDAIKERTLARRKAAGKSA